MNKPFFKPWKPPCFNGILIIAESCPKGNEVTDSKTGWEAHPDSEWPYKFIINHVKEKIDQNDDTFRMLLLSFLYDGKELDVKEFWERHAFTNLVPRLMGRNSNNNIEKPNNGEDKRNALEQFDLIIDYVKPKGIYIPSGWCVETLKVIANKFKDYEPDIWEMTFRNNIPAIGVYHPKSRGYTKEVYLKQARKATRRLWRNINK